MTIHGRIPVLVVMLVLGLTAGQAASAQPPGASGYTHTSWTEFSDPLHPPSVYAITQDGDGFIWLGMLGGPVRFDGVRFTRWDALGRPTLPERSVTALATAPDGTLWIGYGNFGGISRYTNGTIRHFTSSDGVPTGAIRTLIVGSDGAVWAVGYGGLARFQNGRWEPAGADQGILPRAIHFVREDEQGTVWVVTQAGIYHRATGSATFARAGAGTAPARIFGDGLAWAVHRHRIDIAAPTLNPTITPQAFKDSRGDLWAWVRDALVVVRPNASAPARFTTLEGLTGNQVTALYEDGAGAVWVGTSRGLDAFRLREPGAPMLRRDVSQQVLTTIAAPDGVWAGTMQGLLRISGDSVTAYSEQDGLPGRRITALHLDNRGTLWVAGDQGIAVRRGARFVRMSPPGEQVFNQVAAIATDTEGSLWVSDFQSLHRLKDGVISHPVVPGLEEQRSSVVYTDHRGRVWIGFWNGSVARYDGGAFHVYSTADGLAAGRITAIVEDATGTMWAGSLNGVSRLDGDRWVTPGRDSGLDGLMVQWIHRDAYARLWLGTNSGVIRLNIPEFDRTVRTRGYRPRLRIFGPPSEAARLAFGASGHPRVASTPDGRLWLAASAGLATIDTTAVSEGPAPPVRIEQVAVDDRSVPLDRPVQVRVGTARIRIDYTALALGGTSRLMFRYRLDGFDKDWVEAGTSRQAVYTNLPPGDYRFHVSASHDGSPWGEGTLNVPFTVFPPFYRTTWFYSACIAALALLLWGAYQVRVRQLRWHYSAVLAERARLGREIHDTLLQGMLGVALQLHSLLDRVDGSGDVAGRVTRARDTLEHYIRETRLSIWDLRSPTLERLALADAIRMAGETLTTATDTTFELRVTGTAVRGEPHVEAHLLRIAHEAISNAVRHGHASRVDVELTYDGDGVRVAVRDNGHGFDTSDATRRTPQQWGLATMRERAQQIGADFRCASGPGGTTVETAAPLPVVG
ncbi:MAG: two-component regulator propeller domain-containing protein [Vicinamibacterales bacterium]